MYINDFIISPFPRPQKKTQQNKNLLRKFLSKPFLCLFFLFCFVVALLLLYKYRVGKLLGQREVTTLII